MSDGPASPKDATGIVSDADSIQPDANSECLVWEADFSADPTQQDLNGDQAPDWVVRGGGVFPVGQLGGGVWTSPSNAAALDTNPKHDFDGHTILRGQFRSTEVADARAAVFWINVDFTPSNFAPVYVSLRLQADATQTLTLYGKTNNATEVVLSTTTGLGTGDIEVRLDFDASTDQVTLGVESVVIGTFDYFTVARIGSDDRFATAFAYGSDAVFNSMQVEACP